MNVRLCIWLLALPLVGCDQGRGASTKATAEYQAVLKAVFAQLPDAEVEHRKWLEAHPSDRRFTDIFVDPRWCVAQQTAGEAMDFRRPKLGSNLDPAERMWQPVAVVLAMIFLEAVTRQANLQSSGLLRIASNAETLISSSFLILAIIEPLRGITSSSASETRFRLVFAGTYASMVALSVLWVNGAPEGSETSEAGSMIKVGCALGALIGLVFALRYRTFHPLEVPVPQRSRARNDDAEMGERILQIVRDGRFTEPDLKVADIAVDVGEPSYRVSQCITGTLGFRNFNQMINAFRLEEARRRLLDPDFAHLPILTIAYDSGFGSIGPFNRLFRSEVGMTPKQFRRLIQSD